MIRICTIFLCVGLFFLKGGFFVGTIWAGTVEDEGGLLGISTSTNTFAIELYRRIASNPNDNLFFSPYSVYTVFSMVYGGVRGDTALQMERVLKFPMAGTDLHEYVGRLSSAIEKAGSQGAIKLAISNRMWPQVGYPFLKEYLELIQRNYGVKISPLDYRKDPEDARKTINSWVEEKTEQKIVNLLKPGMISPHEKMVLVNAIYFKGDWSEKFDRKATQEEQFFLLSGGSVKAPLMTTRQSFGYNDLQDAQVLELPYSGKDLSMIVMLPKKKDGLQELEKNLSLERLKSWTGELHKREVVVYLPRFKSTSEFRLDRVLSSMGMPDVFNEEKADFSGMDGRKKNLFIGMAIHKAYVDVNEEGTEAAAATAVGIRTTSIPSLPPVFRADHPFLYVIRHNTTGVILFMGRVVNPLKNLDT